MKSTAKLNDAAPYVGADLTDRHARGQRPVDVCGLWPAPDGTLAARFWAWTWPGALEPLHVDAIAAEIRQARAAMLDGPQALATAGHSQRACEQACGAPGKTPGALPATDRPFAGYLRSSVELFGALHRCGTPISPCGFVGGACEYYPGDAWRRLTANRLSRKDTRAGRSQRRDLLVSLGITGLPELPSHDQADACLGALLAAAADDRVRGLGVEAVGKPLAVDPDGILREGPMAVPRADDALRRRIDSPAGVSAPSRPARKSCASRSASPEADKDARKAMERAARPRRPGVRFGTTRVGQIATF